MRKKTYRLFKKSGNSNWVLWKTENHDNSHQAHEKMMPIGVTNVDGRVYENKFSQYYISEEV